MEGTRERLLHAAGTVIRRDGVRAMTLQAVAHEAGVSKGGLLYHFPSKRELIAAMARARSERLDRTARAFAERHPQASPVAAYVAAVAAAPPDDLDAALLAASFEEPALLEAYRQEAVQAYQRMAAQAGDPILAFVVGLACDGLWVNELFDTHVPGSGHREAVLARLTELAGLAAADAPPAADAATSSGAQATSAELR